MAAGFFRSLYNLFVGCARAAKLDIVLNGIVEQVDTLEYHTHILQEAVTGKFFDIVAAYGNAAFLRIPKPGNQPRNRGFASAGGADNCSHAALRNGKAHILQNRAAIFIGKENMIKSNIKTIQRNIFAVLVDFFRLPDAFYPAKGSVHHSDHGCHLPHYFNGVKNCE